MQNPVLDHSRQPWFLISLATERKTRQQQRQYGNKQQPIKTHFTHYFLCTTYLCSLLSDRLCLFIQINEHTLYFLPFLQ